MKPETTSDTKRTLFRAFFTSDLHIRNLEDSACQWLKRLVLEAQAGDEIYLLGDIFDLWIGDSQKRKNEFLPLLQAFEQAVDHKAKITFIEGNHDFGFSKTLQEFGVTVVEDEITVELENNLKVYLAHGDLSDSSDFKYLLFRRTARWLLKKSPLRFLSTNIKDQISEQIKKTLSPRIYQKFSQLDPDYQNRIRKVFRTFAEQKSQHVDVVILGHCHDLTDVKLGQKRYFNLGFWNLDQKFLQYHQGEWRWVSP